MATLPISELKNATNVTTNTIKTASGVTGTPPDDIKLSEFKINSVLSLSANRIEIPYGGTFDAILNLSGEQQYFYRIKNIASNFVSTINTSRLSIISETQNLKRYQNIYNPKGTGGGTSTLETVRVKFFDKGYNEDCVGYNTDFITTVRLYTPPKPTISFVEATKPPRPCCTTNTKCCDASITIDFNTNPNFGINSTFLNIYYSTNNINFTLHSTQLTNSGRVVIGSLIGDTLYYIKAINNFDCSSETLQASTLKYV
jgi:hypothetical protein